MLSIAISLIVATGTGIMLDKGKTIGVTNSQPAASSDNNVTAAGENADAKENEEESIVSEIHEFFSNLLLLAIGMHASYLLLFRRPLAKFMLFLSTPSNRKGSSRP